MKIYLVEAEHFEIPGRILQAFGREADARRLANEQANLIIKEACGIIETPYKPLPLDASGEDRAARLVECLDAMECYHEGDAYANVIEIQVYP
jgi:hypothetical protein